VLLAARHELLLKIVVGFAQGSKATPPCPPLLRKGGDSRNRWRTEALKLHPPLLRKGGDSRNRSSAALLKLHALDTGTTAKFSQSSIARTVTGYHRHTRRR